MRFDRHPPPKHSTTLPPCSLASPATSQAVNAFKTAVRQWRIGRVIPSSLPSSQGTPSLAVGESFCCKETILSLLFKGSDLKPVLAEAIANQYSIILVKDQGVYWLAERGERQANGSQRLLAYAVGCNPDVDVFDDWWALARKELGGDDFAEHFDPHSEAFTPILNGEEDLELAATATYLMLRTVTP